MIVIDANILIYSLIDGPKTTLVRSLREKDGDWRTTGLCMHEILNVLTTYERQKVLSLAKCKKLLEHAERFLHVAECEVKMSEALAVAAKYTITGYDAQYVALAKMFDVPLITEDRKLREAVPGIALSMAEYLG